MGLFRKKHQLKKAYDKKLFDLMQRQKTKWEDSKVMEEIVVDETPSLTAERKCAKARYFYLFKEAKKRQLKGDL